MHFATLSGLWFSLSIPFILLLYMLKRRYIDTEISSHMLWRRVLREQEANQPWQRLKRQLLLLLQLLAASLLVLALMQPFIRGHQTAKSHVFFVLDASASMQTLTNQGSTRLEQAKADILSYVREEAPNRTYSLMVIKDQPELLLQKESALPALRAALDKVIPFYGRTNVQESLSLASALIREESDSEVRIYTDIQWSEKAEEIVFSVPVQIVSVQGSGANLPTSIEDGAVNVSISQFGVKNSETESRAVAVLKNWGAVSIAVETKLFADSQAVRTDTLQLKAGEQKSIYFEKLASANVYKLQLVTKDALEADNTAYAFSEETGRTQIAYVGEGSLFLQKALMLAKAEVLHIQKSGDGTYPPPIGRSPHLIILDGVNESDLASKEWREILASKPIWRFASSESAEAVTLKFPYTIEDHPIMRYIRLQDVNIAQAQSRTALPWEKVIVSSSGIPLMLAGMEDGAPRLSFTFPLDQTDLALRSEFPILVQNAVAWLTQHQGGNLGRVTAGERIDVSLHPQAVKAVWTMDPEGDSGEPAERNGNALASRQTVPKLPGLYTFKEFDEGGHVVGARLLEAVMDARESNVNAFSESKLSYKPNPEVQALTDKGNDSGAGFASLVPWIVLVLIMLLVTEWEVYRRGHSV
ncbi:vWA domain-containing protein [Paenibacillus planticolens]|uniref:VWA domain-containing protein n=1 Tax=Paenibacillus planticolens TaxID=2654976 RepID=A0ABX1ZTU9_9BACL|nr:VWA domain-containing protein [Paenibacillus planticolens]NOV03449.1 VWA domain-containing protein [Paenibacillus planticolens]